MNNPMCHRLAHIALALLATCFSAGATVAQTLRVVTEDTSYTYLVGDRVGGPATDAVEAILQRAGLTDYSVGLYPWARAYDMAQREPNVLIYLIARTPERENLFKWAAQLTRIEYHLYKLRERNDLRATDLNALRGFSIGVLRDDVRHTFLQGQGFTRLVVSAQNTDNFRKLLNRQVDLVPMPERDARQFCLEEGIPYDTLEPVLALDALVKGLYMAFSPGTSDEVVERAREAFAALSAEGEILRLLGE